MKYFEPRKIISDEVVKEGQDNIYLINGKELRRSVNLYYPFGTFTSAQDQVIHDIINFLIRENIFDVESEFNKQIGTKEWKYDSTVRQRVVDQKNPYRPTLAINERVLDFGEIPQFEEVMRCVSCYDGILDEISQKYYRKFKRKKTKKTIKDTLKILFKDIFWVGNNSNIIEQVGKIRRSQMLALAAKSEWTEKERKQSVDIFLKRQQLRNEEKRKLLEYKQANLKGVGEAGVKQVDFDVNSIRDCTVYAIQMNEEIIYVGCTWREVQERWNEHIQKAKNGDSKILYRTMREGEVVFRILWQGEANRIQLEAMEYGFISFFKPKCNLEGVNRQYKFSINDGRLWKGKRVKSWRLKSAMDEEGVRMLEELK